MKNPLFSFANCLRHAFMTGAGYGDLDRISDEDIYRWCCYDPPEVGPFATMAEVIAAYRRETVVDGEPETKTVPFELVRAKDLEYMWKEIRANIPKGSIWQHKGNEAFYRVEGLQLNTITDEWDVEYIPLYNCKIESFTRQAVNHDKAFAVRFTLVNDGTQYGGGRLYPDVFRTPPKENDE